MKAAEMMLVVATTRARRSAGAQAWTAANEGTMNSPPAAARPNRSTTRRMPCQVVTRSATASLRGLVAVVPISQARSSPNTPMNRAPTGTTPRLGLSLEARAARPEPTAMPTTKTIRQAVTSFWLPPRASFTMDGSIDSMTAPTTQNHETMTAPFHRRASCLSSASSIQVERKGLRSTAMPGEEGPGEGMSSDRPQAATAIAIIAPATSQAGTWPTASPPASVPRRMAMKVALSMRALPAVSSLVVRSSGRMPYLMGPKRADRSPVSPSAVISTVTDCR